MRKLSKGQPHEAIKNFEGLQEWSLSSSFHRTWREIILGIEQHGLSGYTEVPLRIEDSHIDHFYKLRNCFLYGCLQSLIECSQET